MEQKSTNQQNESALSINSNNFFEKVCLFGHHSWLKCKIWKARILMGFDNHQRSRSCNQWHCWAHGWLVATDKLSLQLWQHNYAFSFWTIKPRRAGWDFQIWPVGKKCHSCFDNTYRSPVNVFCWYAQDSCLKHSINYAILRIKATKYCDLFIP